MEIRRTNAFAEKIQEKREGGGGSKRRRIRKITAPYLILSFAHRYRHINKINRKHRNNFFSFSLWWLKRYKPNNIPIRSDRLKPHLLLTNNIKHLLPHFLHFSKCLEVQKVIMTPLRLEPNRVACEKENKPKKRGLRMKRVMHA